MPAAMNTRILVIGNCHAQYIAAALSAVGEVEVAVIGRPFAGPVMFKGKRPTFITGLESHAWLLSATKGVVLTQAAIRTHYALHSRLARDKSYPLIKVPFVKFEAPFTDADPGGDRRHNETCFEAAGASRCGLDDIEHLIETRPVL